MSGGKQVAGTTQIKYVSHHDQDLCDIKTYTVRQETTSSDQGDHSFLGNTNCISSLTISSVVCTMATLLPSLSSDDEGPPEALSDEEPDQVDEDFEFGGILVCSVFVISLCVECFLFLKSTECTFVLLFITARTFLTIISFTLHLGRRWSCFSTGMVVQNGSQSTR
jgi:hypothetical protein